MTSRSRSGPTVAAMSIERTTSANRTVTCLYSAWASRSVTGAPQPSQNRAPSRGSVPHMRHAAMAVTRPSADPRPPRFQGLRIGGWTLHDGSLAATVIPAQSFDSLISCLFRDGVQFCSGLVDLVVGVRRHGGGGHRLTLAGERFVGLVAEDIA